MGPAHLGRVHACATARCVSSPDADAVTIDGQPKRRRPSLRTDSRRKARAWSVQRGQGHLHRDRTRRPLRAAREACASADAACTSPAWSIGRVAATGSCRHDSSPHPPGKTLPIVNIIGIIEAIDNPGAVEFQRDGKTYRLEALDEGEDTLFLVFADRTSGHGSYGAGRFLYARSPDAQGRVTARLQPGLQPAVRLHRRSRPVRCRRLKTASTWRSGGRESLRKSHLACEGCPVTPRLLTLALAAAFALPAHCRPAQAGCARCTCRARRRQAHPAPAAVEGLRRRQRRVPARLVPPAQAGRLSDAGGHRRAHSTTPNRCCSRSIRRRDDCAGNGGDDAEVHGLRQRPEPQQGAAEGDAGPAGHAGVREWRLGAGARAERAVGGEPWPGARREPGDRVQAGPRPRPPPDGARGQGRQTGERAGDRRGPGEGDGCGADPEQAQWLDEFLLDPKKAIQELQDMHAWWRAGDVERLDKDMRAEMATKTPQSYKRSTWIATMCGCRRSRSA